MKPSVPLKHVTLNLEVIKSLLWLMMITGTNHNALAQNSEPLLEYNGQILNEQFPNIVGGIDTIPGKYPFHVHSGSRVLCGGSLIHPDVVITAAHCADAFAKGEIVYIGARNQNPGRLAEQIRIEFALPHYRYNDRTTDSDIMLVKLSRASSAPVIQINRDPNAPTTGAIVTAIGFGDTSFRGSSSDTLKEVQVPVVSHESCTRSVGPIDRNTVLCAGASGKDTCQGDSGGPLFQNNILYGITSFGDGCGRSPGAYTRVSSFAGWVDDFICRHSSVPPASCFCGAGGEICQRRNNGCDKYTCLNGSCQRVQNSRECSCGSGSWDGSECVCNGAFGRFRRGWCPDKDGFCTFRGSFRFFARFADCEI